MFSGWFGGSKKPEDAPEVKKEVTKPKPCCVCKEEKTKRDECMLQNEDGEKVCADLITQYKQCMKSYGFDV